MAKKNDIKQKVGPIEAKRLGSEVAQYKRRVSAKAWKQLVADAHKRGITVRSAITEAGMPDALRERTKSSLKTEAERNIADAYKPAATELDSAEARAKALSAKRQQDNVAYRTWMDQQSAVQAAQAAGAQQRYEQWLAQQQAQATQAGQLQAAAQQAAAGGVSDMSQSTAIKGLAADEQRSQAQVANARAQTAAMIPSTTAQQQNLTLATRAMFDAAETKRTGDENKDLTNVFTAREKLMTSKAADVLKEYGRMLDNELVKAQSNRDYAAAAEQLGLKTFQAQQDAVDAERDDARAAKKLTLEEWKARNKAKVDAAKVQLGYDRIAAQQGRAAADRALKRELERIRANRAAKPQETDGARRDSTRAYQTVNTVRGMLEDAHRQWKNGKTPAGRSFRQWLRDKGYDDVTIDVAEDARKNGGKLSARGRLKARRIGIKDPEKVFGRA